MRIVSSSLILAAIVLAGASTAVIAQGSKPAPVTIEQHAATMKTIAQNAGAAGKALKGGDAAAATPAAEALVTAFTTVETFYTQRNKPDAVKAAQTAKMVDQALKGETVDINDTTTYDNGVKVVPSYLLTPHSVDISNYEKLLIESGYIKPEDLQ